MVENNELIVKDIASKSRGYALSFAVSAHTANKDFRRLENSPFAIASRICFIKFKVKAML